MDGLAGILVFSASLPAAWPAPTGFDASFLTAARAVIAGVAAGAAPMPLRQRRPARGDLAPLAIVALGVVIGFPLSSALALRHVGAARAAVCIGLLPLATAIFGALRAGARRFA